MIRWLWRRWCAPRSTPIELQPGQRWPDGDTVVPDGQRRWADLLAPEPDPLTEPTRHLPMHRPLMTPAGQWRARRWAR